MTKHGRFESAQLWLRVQADAFRLNPLAYLQAVAWRARGWKVRSRSQIAALAGHSRWAYRYWVACRETDPDSTPPSTGVKLVPIIDCRTNAPNIGRTIESVSWDLKPIVIGAGVNSLRTLPISAPSRIGDVITGEAFWLCPIFSGDRLARGALEVYAKAIQAAPDATIIYSDDDLVDDVFNRSAPHFKPDWNPELFECHDFLTGACIIRSTMAEITQLPDEGWAEVLVRRALKRGPAPVHLHHVLHHRMARPEPIVPPAHLAPPIGDAPPVTVIVPTRNRAELLEKCLSGIEETDYPALEVIIVDNDSDEVDTLNLLEEARRKGVKVINVSGAFNFSVLNNRAVEHAAGKFLCFLNNDVEITGPHWLAYLVHQAVKPDIGAVGARLLYSDGTVQHAGVFTGIGGGAGHGHRHQRHDERGYFERSRLPQRISAVTAACMVVAKEKFLVVQGFDEEQFAVAFNDVDLCLKLNAMGWQSFYEPRATLIHHESRSRGSDRARSNRARFAGELEALKQKWGTDRIRDPYHHPNLSPYCEQFLVSV